MSTEDDTFKALTRVPFDDVIRADSHQGESFDHAYREIVEMVASGTAIPNSQWKNVAGGWDFEDFKAECVKRYKEMKNVNRG